MKWYYNEPRKFDDYDQESYAMALFDALKSDHPVASRLAPGLGKTIIIMQVIQWLMEKNEIDSAIIVVPTKALQDQYVTKYDGVYPNIRMSILMGRDNFKCLNERIGHEKCAVLNQVKRVESCPYANPVVSSNRVSAVLKAAPNLDEAGRYNSLMGEKVVTVRVGGESCPYYSQFMNYLKSNVIVMNTQMFQYAVLTGSLRIDEGRTLLVLDEADEVIETLIPSTVLSVEWVMENFGVIINAINDAIKRREAKELMSEVIRMIRKAKSTTNVVEIASSINKLFNLVKENDLEVDSLEVLNMINILNKLGSTIDWVRINTDAIGLIVRRIGDYLFNTFFKSFHPHLLFISGTLPNKSLLDYLTSIDWEFIDGRKKMLGKIHLMSKGYTQISALKMRNSNSNDHYKEAIGSGIITTLTAMLDERNRKILVLPHLKVMCKDIIYRRYTGVPYDYDGQLLREFLKNDSPRIVCSTRAVRGVDGSDVDAVVILKAPYPSMEDAFIKAMKRVLGERDWSAFYTWLAEREVYQMIGRALRREDSEVRLYVSDINVYYIINSLESQGFIELIDESDELGSAIFEPSIENELGQFLIPLAIIVGTNGGIKMPVAVAKRLEEMRAGTIQKIIQEPLQLKNEEKKETQPNKKESIENQDVVEDQDSTRDTVIAPSITSTAPNKGGTEEKVSEAQAKGDVGSVDSGSTVSTAVSEKLATLSSKVTESSSNYSESLLNEVRTRLSEAGVDPCLALPILYLLDGNEKMSKVLASTCKSEPSSDAISIVKGLLLRRSNKERQ